MSDKDEPDGSDQKTVIETIDALLTTMKATGEEKETIIAHFKAIEADGAKSRADLKALQEGNVKVDEMRRKVLMDQLKLLDPGLAKASVRKSTDILQDRLETARILKGQPDSFETPPADPKKKKDDEMPTQYDDYKQKFVPG